MNADQYSRRVLRNAGVALAFGWVLSAALCRGEVFDWSEPAIDTWSYSNGFGGGGRLTTPSFGAIFVNDEQTALEEGGSSAPSRLGSMLVAFETSEEVTPSLDPSRYAIQSASVTVRMQSGSTGALPYADQPITPAGLLAEALSGGVTAQQPMELFGVGFRGGYEGFALGPEQTGTRFAESTSVYSSAAGGYIAYPVVGDGAGGYADVSNNLTGGFSATSPGGHTAPFDATPWAIGASGLNAGDSVPNDTTFTFEIDLSQPGVVDYLQRSLSDGALGFFVSSVHPASQPGTGGTGAYPQWYAKEALGIYPGAEAPTLSLDVEVLPLAGDYDGDGEVTPADYSAWAASYGSVPTAPGKGADGNADGIVNAADYTVWRDAFAAAIPPAAAVPVPEPLSYLCLSAGLLFVFFTKRQRPTSESRRSLG